MDKQKIFEFYKRNEKMHETYMNEVPGVSEQYWDELSDFIASDIDGTIKFMCEDPDCNDEIFSDWS